MKKIFLSLMILLPVSTAQGITRTEVMVRAKAYAYHPWRCTPANLTASCSSSYQSYHVPGDYIGVAYDWGGYMTLFEFDQQIASGYGAGSHVPDGILDCTAGVDCSGYVSKCWETSHHTTISIPQISQLILQSQVLAGDVFNKYDAHVVLFSHTLANGDPVYFEAGYYNVQINTYEGWSSVSGFEPRRYDNIQGTSASDPLGTTENPILINSLPYTDTRDTTVSASSVLDGCGAAPGTDESGPEYIYKLELTQPGSLTVSVSDDVGVDIDVHLYTSMNTNDCVARHNTSFTYQVDCGTYYIVADTWGSYAGSYSMQVAFTPSAQPCGSGPPVYQPLGELGDPCRYPGGDPSLPFCNPNLGTEICLGIANTTTTFCTKSCNSDADCTFFANGCCLDIDPDPALVENYCIPTTWCAPPPVDAGVPPPPPDGGPLDREDPPPDSAQPDLFQPADGAVALPDGAPAPDLGSSDAAQARDGAAHGDGKNGGDHDEGGCQCQAGGPQAPSCSWLLLGLLGLCLRRRIARRVIASFRIQSR